MMKRAALVIAAFVSLAALSRLSAGELPSPRIGNDFPQIDEAAVARTFAMDRSDVFYTIAAPDLLGGLPTLALLDGQRLPLSNALAQMTAVPANLFPLTFATVTAVPRRARYVPDDSKEAPVDVIDNHNKVWDMGGEVGMYYGRSIGSNGRSGDAYGAYIVGGIGNEKVQVTAGASYEESNFRFRRPRP